MNALLCEFQPNSIVQRWMAVIGLLLAGTGLTSAVQAAEAFLPQEQAFAFSVQSVSDRQAQLHWQIAPDYYLYQHKFNVTRGQQTLHLSFPPARRHHDAYFGDSAVYFDQVHLTIDVRPNQHYRVQYQGCAAQGLCYPVSQTEFATDAQGLVIQQPVAPASTDLFAQKKSAGSASSLFDQRDNQQQDVATDSPGRVTTPPVGDPSISSSTQLSDVQQPEDDSATRSRRAAEDQQWSQRLQQQSVGWSVLVFLGLGMLLAFSPCSLPMLPILSGLLVRRHAGVRAGLISLVFVLAMASVYAVLGLLAASIGTGFQRWLQQPLVLAGFALLFVGFALNLFGAFELELPQRWVNRLDRLQQRQQGGTLLGAAVMGVLSALLVGPCMTAPLAGTLLYISQTQNTVLGAILLFSLGLGMGLPLLLLSMIGEQALPRAGQWMHSVRHGFGFIMLGLAVYFVRPLLPLLIYTGLMMMVAVGLLVYLLRVAMRHQQTDQQAIRNAALIAMLAVGATTAWKGHGYWQQWQAQQRAGDWQIVQTRSEFEQALIRARQSGQPILIDVYADWCVACQPIERTIWGHPAVTQALQGWQRIKLDLTHFEPSQQGLLKQWEILGPPTVILLNAQGQEQRPRRLTGEFDRAALLDRLKSSQSTN